MSLAGAGIGAAKGLSLLQAILQRQQALDQDQSQAEMLLAQRKAEAEMDAANQAEGRKLQARQIDLADTARRGNQNTQQLDLMNEQAAQMAQSEGMQNLPPHLRQLVDVRRVVGNNIRPEDLQTPEERATAQEAEDARKVKVAGAMADAQAAAAARHRKPDAPPPTGPTGLSPQQERAAMSFMDDYARDSKPFLTMRDAYQRVAASAKGADGASDMSMIFGYMKLLDPTSVVRETEYANAQNAAGVPDQIRNMYNKVLEGVRLTPTQRQQFLAQANRLFSESTANHERVRQTYTTRAQRWGIPTELILDQDAPSAPSPADAPQPDGAPPAPAGNSLYERYRQRRPGGQ